MIPEKIYLGIGPLSGDEPNKKYLYAEWYEEPKPLVKNIEYIRKDALLEWAKEKLKEWDSTSSTGQGIRMGLTVVIDKLNSM